MDLAIDSFVLPGSSGCPGLGQHLCSAMSGRVPAITVAKSRTTGTPAAAELIRGLVRRPLSFTAAGLHLAEATSRIQTLCGSARLPNLRKRVAQLCRRMT